MQEARSQFRVTLKQGSNLNEKLCIEKSNFTKEKLPVFRKKSRTSGVRASLTTPHSGNLPHL